MGNCYRSCYRFLAGVLIVLTAWGIARPVLAQQKQEPGNPADLPAADSPAVAAILETNPTTPAELVRAAKILADLQRPDLGKQMLGRVIAAKLDQQQLADLAEQFGTPVFSGMAARQEMLPEAKQLADAVTAAVNRRLQDPDRLAQLVRQLGEPSPDSQVAALVGLKEARGPAVAALLAVMADPGRQAEHPAVRVALVNMGPDAIGPLLGMLEASDPKLAGQTIQVLSAMGVKGAAIHLLAPFVSEKSDPELRSAAGAALQRLMGRTPSPAMAVRLLTERAVAYFDRAQPVRADIDGQVELWHWDAAAKQCTATRYDAEDAALILAARLARDAYALAPEDPDVRRLYLATMLEAAAYRNGLDKPLPEGQRTAFAEAAGFGAAVLEDVLDYAMSGDHVAAAAATARILGQTGKASELLYKDAKPTPLVRAARHSDRRVRMAACEAIVRLKPTELFPGASFVPESLALAAGSSGTRRVLVAGPSTEASRKLVGMLGSLGLEVDTATTGRDVIRAATASPDYELALIETSIDGPTVDFLVQELRRDYRTATLRVGLLARADDFLRAERIAGRDPMTMAFYRPHDDQTIAWQVERLAGLATRTFVDHAQRQQQAAAALDLLREISTSGNKLYDVRSTQESVLAALYTPGLSLKAVEVLANINSPDSQRALVDLASRWTQPLEIRRAACKAFLHNTRQHGILLTAEEITRQYDRYNASEALDQETQQILGLLLDTIEAPSKIKDQG